jgi:uncharacterized repeat protein (TIGR01451 family)
VGGYQMYRGGVSDLSDEAQSDLEAGFESAQGNDTLGNLAAAWNRETATAAAENAANEEGEMDAAVVPTSATQADSRYASQQLASDSELPPLPPATDRYADVPATDEPHSAEETIARGQSPAIGMPPLEALPDANPLRSAESDPFGADGGVPVADASRAPQAFDEPAPLPMGESGNYREMVGPAPSDVADSNPLRSAEVPQPAARDAFDAAQPTELGEFTDARPMAAAPYQENAFGNQANARDSYAQPIAEEPANPQPMARRVDNQPAPEPQLADEPASDHSGNAFLPGPDGAALSPAIDEGTGRPGERALEGPQRPALVLQKFAPEEIQVGKECQFVIKVRNVGQRPADNVVVEDEVPQGTRFVSASPSPEPSGSTLAWQLGTLSPGEERTMEVQLMPTEEGEIGSVAQVTFASHASAKSRCTRPQLALRMTAPGEVLIGRQQRLTIELHNPGTGDATGVVLLENVPENVRHQAGPTLEFEVGTLRAGETRRMELVLTAEKPGRVVNTLTARADGNLQVQQDVEFEVISPALAVDVKGPARRYLERPATYTVSIDNPGTAPAKDIQLVTKLPKGLQFVRANNMGEYDSATHSVYWSLAELPEGQNGTVELVALPVQSGDHTIEVEGRAREGLEDRTTQPVRIEGLAAIMFTVSDTQDPIEVGGTTSYEIRVVNQGSKAATNVQVTALVPPGMTVTNAQGETRHAVEAEGVVFEPLARLAPKADSVYRVDVQGVRPGDQRLMVEVQTDDIDQPIRKEESTRVFGDE